MLVPRVVRALIEGVEQQRRTREHVHDGTRLRRAREQAQIASGQLAAGVDAGVEVRKLTRARQATGDEQVRHLLVAEATDTMRFRDEVIEVIAADDEVALVRHDLAIDLVVAVNVRDGREAHEHARSVGVAQAAFDVVLAKHLLRQLVDLGIALVKAFAFRGTAERSLVRGHGSDVRDAQESRGIVRRQDATRNALASAAGRQMR